jgi:hypothetical protein
MVPNGWSGKDTGLNYCNQCTCVIGALTCTKIACISQLPIKNSFVTKIFGNGIHLQRWKHKLKLEDLI